MLFGAIKEFSEKKGDIYPGRATVAFARYCLALLYMLRPLLLFNLIFVFVFSLQSSAQTPAAISAKIDKATSKIHSLASLWGTLFLQEYNGEQHFDTLGPVRAELQEYLENQIEDFKNTKDIGNFGQLRASLLTFLEYEKDLVEQGFGPFEKLPATASESDVTECRNKLTDKAAREKELLAVLNKDRREYAEANHFPLVPPPAAPKASKPRLRYSDLVDGELPSKSAKSNDEEPAQHKAPKAVPPSHRDPPPGEKSKDSEKKKKEDNDEDDDGDE